MPQPVIPGAGMPMGFQPGVIPPLIPRRAVASVSSPRGFIPPMPVGGPGFIPQPGGFPGYPSPGVFIPPPPGVPGYPIAGPFPQRPPSRGYTESTVSTSPQQPFIPPPPQQPIIIQQPPADYSARRGRSRSRSRSPRSQSRSSSRSSRAVVREAFTFIPIPPSKFLRLCEWINQSQCLDRVWFLVLPLCSRECPCHHQV